MFRWIVTVQVIVLIVALGVWAHRVFFCAGPVEPRADADTSDRFGSGVNTSIDSSFPAFGAAAPFAVRWTEKPLGELSAPAIHISKSAHVITVFDAGRAVKSYRAAIGGGQGDKIREADRCTPEGDFYVCVRNPQSQYVRSLGLSYPNIEDADRGLRNGLISEQEHRQIAEAIRRGTRPPWKTALGGEIMIHGKGSGRDWTAGCVALDDEAILELFPKIPLHTKVIIHP